MIFLPMTASQQIPIDSGKAAEALFSAVNAYRAGNKVRDLVWNNALWQTAQHYAEVLAASKSAGHGADGKIPQQRAEEKGYPCPVAENAYSSDPAVRIDDEDAGALKALDYWKNSPPDNAVSPLWTETGIGAAAWSHEGQTYTVFVQLFGHPCCGAKPEPVPLLEQTPAPPLERYVETTPVPIRACPDWDPDCRGCPAWNPYCHRCPPWDPACRSCPPWNLHCHRLPALESGLPPVPADQSRLQAPYLPEWRGLAALKPDRPCLPQWRRLAALQQDPRSRLSEWRFVAELQQACARYQAQRLQLSPTSGQKDHCPS